MGWCTHCERRKRLKGPGQGPGEDRGSDSENGARERGARTKLNWKNKAKLLATIGLSAFNIVDIYTDFDLVYTMNSNLSYKEAERLCPELNKKEVLESFMTTIPNTVAQENRGLLYTTTAEFIALDEDDAVESEFKAFCEDVGCAWDETEKECAYKELDKHAAERTFEQLAIAAVLPPFVFVRCPALLDLTLLPFPVCR